MRTPDYYRFFNPKKSPQTEMNFLTGEMTIRKHPKRTGKLVWSGGTYVKDIHGGIGSNRKNVQKKDACYLDSVHSVPELEPCTK